MKAYERHRDIFFTFITVSRSIIKSTEVKLKSEKGGGEKKVVPSSEGTAVSGANKSRS